MTGQKKNVARETDQITEIKMIFEMPKVKAKWPVSWYSKTHEETKRAESIVLTCQRSKIELGDWHCCAIVNQLLGKQLLLSATEKWRLAVTVTRLTGHYYGVWRNVHAWEIYFCIKDSQTDINGHWINIRWQILK